MVTFAMFKDSSVKTQIGETSEVMDSEIRDRNNE